LFLSIVRFKISNYIKLVKFELFHFVFIRLFEKRDVLWEYMRPAGRCAASTGFPLFKSKSFHLVFIKLDEYVGEHNISTKFYNQSNPPRRHSWIITLELSTIRGFPLSKSKSFCPVFIRLGEYVGGHNISTKFYNLPNSPRHPWIIALELSLPFNWPQMPWAYFESIWHSC